MISRIKNLNKCPPFTKGTVHSYNYPCDKLLNMGDTFLFLQMLSSQLFVTQLGSLESHAESTSVSYLLFEIKGGGV
jgi:hypothetical protein